MLNTKIIFYSKIGHFMDINPWYECEKWSNLSRISILSKVYHVKELIVSYRKMFE